MKINKLNERLEEIIEKGHGSKEIYLESDGGEELEIDSVQKNTNPDVEPDYYFLMAGKYVEVGINYRHGKGVRHGA